MSFWNSISAPHFGHLRRGTSVITYGMGIGVDVLNIRVRESAQHPNLVTWIVESEHPSLTPHLPHEALASCCLLPRSHSSTRSKRGLRGSTASLGCPPPLCRRNCLDSSPLISCRWGCSACLRPSPYPCFPSIFIAPSVPKALPRATLGRGSIRNTSSSPMRTTMNAILLPRPFRRLSNPVSLVITMTM